MRIVAVIPARGGSKGIRRKNLMPLAGHPLIFYSIYAALKAKGIDEVFVSTEDEEIAMVSRHLGAEVILRPAELAEDTTPTEPVLEHTVEVLEKDGSRVDVVVLLQATSPLRNAEHIDEAIGVFTRHNADSLLAVCRNHGFIWENRNGGFASINYDYRSRPRRQDMEQFRENGSIYVTKRDILMNEHNRLGGRIEIYEMSENVSIDIDSLDDLKKAEDYFTSE
jgi:CMP-N,N'-diacetyllegionaminic acid synthase